MEWESQINRTVDGAVLSILLTGLQPNVRYTVVVAAATRLGVGAQSPPVSLLLSESFKLLQLRHTERKKYGRTHFQWACLQQVTSGYVKLRMSPINEETSNAH